MINMEITGTRVLFSVQGNLDAETSPQLMADLENLELYINEIIFDLAELEYMSSMGLRAILTGFKMMKSVHRRGKFTVVNIPQHVKNIFELSGFLKTFERDEKLVILEKALSENEAEYSLIGVLDGSTAKLVEKELSALKSRNIKSISLDCEKLKSIEPVGCHVLKKVRQNLGGVIHLENTSDDIKQSIKSGGLMTSGIILHDTHINEKISKSFIKNDDAEDNKQYMPHPVIPKKTIQESSTMNTPILEQKVTGSILHITAKREEDFYLFPLVDKDWYSSNSFIKKIIVDASAVPAISASSKSHFNAMRDKAYKNGVTVELKI